MQLKNKVLGTFLILLSLAGVSITSVAAQGPADSKELEIDADNAAVWHGEDWDDQYTDPGAVVYHDGMFHMFRNGFIGWPARVQIGYTISEDGITWEKQGEDPVLRTTDIEYAGTAALAASALVEDDGTWVLYFYTWPALVGDEIGGIGRATAPAPEGPWTPDADLILRPGVEGDWDDTQLVAPSVVKYNDQYLMYYNSPGSDGHERIGLAFSEDGVNWEKYDNPETTEVPYANSDPILEPRFDDEEKWDYDNVLQPNVIVNDEGLVMMYKAHVGAAQDQAIGFATSEDGITWTRLNEEPLFSTADIARRRMWFTEMAYNDGTYYVYLELARGYQAQTDIYAGKFEGPLIGE
jgi:hypothetical protein